MLILSVVLILFQIKSNFWLFRTLLDILMAPFKTVEFRDFFVADQLVSLAIVIFDLEYTICFFLYDAWVGTDYCNAINVEVKPILSALPFLWRLLQQIRRYRDSKDKRHLVNAGKYFCGLPIILFSTLRASYDPNFLYPWILSLILNTTYSFLWDIWMDWSLSFKYLRQTLLYPKQWYYLAMCADFILRCMWTLTISPQTIGIILNPLIFATILAAVEIMRRAMWNLFRMENEQINNIGKFRVVKDVPLPLKKFDTDATIIELEQ